MIQKASAEEPIEHLLTTADVMHSLRVSRSKLYLMVATGELRAVHMGRKMLFRKRDVNALIEKRAAEGTRPKRHKKKGRA